MLKLDLVGTDQRDLSGLVPVILEGHAIDDQFAIEPNAAAYACHGNQMIEIIGDAKGAVLAANSLSNSVPDARRLHRRMALRFSQVL